MKKDISAGRPSTTVVYRPDAGIAGIRLVQDDAARIAVLALPVGDIPRLGVLRGLLGPGRSLDAACAYAWADHGQVYFGETQGIVGRLKDHARKLDMGFGTETYVVSTFDTYLDKPAVLHMQRAFSDAAKRAGLMHVVEGVRPPAQLLAPARAAAIERMIADAYPLFFDAGLRAFHSSGPPNLDRLGLARRDDEQDSRIEEEDTNIEIGAIVGPDPMAECQLTYANVWAHGYAYSDKFVLGIGSEVRAQTNPSSNPIYTERRMQLLRRGALTPILDVTDRLRLVQPVAVGSASVAAKLVCGAHVTAGVWKMRPRRPAA
jgi:hypothetical protein